MQELGTGRYLHLRRHCKFFFSNSYYCFHSAHLLMGLPNFKLRLTYPPSIRPSSVGSSTKSSIVPMESDASSSILIHNKAKNTNNQNCWSILSNIRLNNKSKPKTLCLTHKSLLRTSVSLWEFTSPFKNTLASRAPSNISTSMELKDYLAFREYAPLLPLLLMRILTLLHLRSMNLPKCIRIVT